MDELAVRRLRWKCRRGLLELDLVLQNFVDNRLLEADLELLSDLLDMHDNELWDLISGRSDRYEQRFASIVARLRAI